MGIFDDVAHSRGDRGRLPRRRDGDGLVPMVPESRGAAKVMNWRAGAILGFIAVGLVYWLWPQIHILIDAFSNKFNL